MMFTTRDRDNDVFDGANCASDYFSGGWWYRNCGLLSLNGNYEGDVTPTVTGLHVRYIDTEINSFVDTKAVQSVEMIIRVNPV